MAKKSKAATAPAGPRRPGRNGSRDVLAGTVPVATFATLGEIDDVLAAVTDEGFPIECTVIVGTDLRFVEKVEGRITLARAAGYGVVAGAWFGALIASFAAIFGARTVDSGLSMLFGGILLGVVFGAVFGAAAFRVAGPRDGISASPTLVAARYELRTAAELADRLRDLLRAPGAGDQSPVTADELLTR